MTHPIQAPCLRPGCEHAAGDHSRISGCLVQEGNSYCECPSLVSTTLPSQRTEADLDAQIDRLHGPGAAAALDAALAEGHVLADQGSARAYAAEADAWKHDAEHALARLIAAGKPFTAEDLRESIGRDPVHPNAMGSVFRTAARQDRINRTGFTTSTRSSAHARTLTVWTPKA